MTDEHREEQNPSSNSPPKCSAGKDSANECKDDDSIPQRPQNGFDPFLEKSDPEGVRDIVETIENSLYRIIDDNFDHLANHSSNTLGVIVKDSLILKVKQSDKKEVPFDGLKTSLACGPIIDDDLPIGFLPQIESLALGSDSENLSTKRKKSVSLAEEVKVFKGIENEFFADNEGGFCSELIDNRSDKIMDREKSATGSEDRMNDFTRQKIPTPQRSGSSFINYLSRSQSTDKNFAASQYQEFQNSTDHVISSSLPQLISNDERIELSTDDEVEADEDYGKEKSLAADKTSNENVNDDDEKIKEIRKLMNEFLSGLQKPSGYKIRDEDQVPLNLESTQSSEDRKRQSAIEVATVPIRQSQQALEMINTSEKRIPNVNHTGEELLTSDEDIKNADSYVKGNISGMNQDARKFGEKSNNIPNTVDNVTLGDEINSVVEESHSCESSKINDQLLADVRTSGTLGNFEIDVKDVTETSEVGRNDVMKFSNNGQLEELKQRGIENDIKSTFGRKIENLTNDPLSGETLTKVSRNNDNLSKQSSGTDCGTNRQSTTDLSLKQTSSTVSRDGRKSSRKSSRICTSDIMGPDPNNLTAEAFPVFSEVKDVPKQNEFTVDWKAEELPVNLGDEEYEDGGGNGVENSTEALAVIEVLKSSSDEKEPLMESRKDIKWEERDKVNGEEAFTRKSRSIESEGTLRYSSESRTSETVTGSHSSVLFKSEPAVVAYLATPSAVGYQMENERHKEGSSDSEPLNTLSNLKSIFRSSNEPKSEKRSVASIGDIENTDAVRKSSRVEVDLVGIELIKSTKSLQDDRSRIQDKRTKGHKLLDDPAGIENVVQQSCQVVHYDFERNENEEKSENSAVANNDANCPEESVDESIAHKVPSDEDKVDDETAEVSEKKIKVKKVRKSEESAKKFANSLSRIFNSSSNRRNGGKDSRAALASRSSAEDDSYIQEQSSCQIETRKSEVTDNNGEELVAVKSLDSMQDPLTTHKESIQEIKKSSEKVYATKSTTVSHPLMAEDPVEKSQKKSSGKSFAGIRKLFSGASTRNKKDHGATEDQVDHKTNEDSVLSARTSSVTSVEKSVDDAEKSSLLSMAKSYIRRHREIKTEGRGAVKRCTESSQDSITPSAEDQQRISKERGPAKTQTMFSRGMRRLFKKKSSVVDSVASTENGARNSADDLNQSSDVRNSAQTTRDCSDNSALGPESCEPQNSKAKEKSVIEQLVCGAINEPSWKDLGRNESESTVPLLRSVEKKSGGWSQSRSRNRCTISDDDRDDIETSSNLAVPGKHTAEIRFMEQDEPENKTDNLAQKQRLSEIVSNIDFRPIPSFAGRRSTIVMMAAPMAPREEANPQESSRSNQARDEPSSSPTVFYYLLGPSLDEALIDVRVIFQNLIDKIIGRRR